MSPPTGSSNYPSAVEEVVPAVQPRHSVSPAHVRQHDLFKITIQLPLVCVVCKCLLLSLSLSLFISFFSFLIFITDLSSSLPPFPSSLSLSPSLPPSPSSLSLPLSLPLFYQVMTIYGVQLVLAIDVNVSEELLIIFDDFFMAPCASLSLIFVIFFFISFTNRFSSLSPLYLYLSTDCSVACHSTCQEACKKAVKCDTSLQVRITSSSLHWSLTCNTISEWEIFP